MSKRKEVLICIFIVVGFIFSLPFTMNSIIRADMNKQVKVVAASVSWSDLSYHNVTFYENYDSTGMFEVLTYQEISKSKGRIPQLDSVFYKQSYDKTFICWNTKPDGTGVSYYPGETFSKSNQPVNLYAIWQ